ncbi:MAG: ATP-binding protein [Desulfovermiculus sp.]|nr:ATP-binding protein [Desulfovermiculus sp.]
MRDSDCQWIKEHQNLIITGPTGIGKTWLACAFAHKACREGFSALYARLPRLLQDLAIARGDGRYPKLMKELANVNLLILDDWGLCPIKGDQPRDLLEVLEDRHGLHSTLVTSQLPVEKWYDYLGDPTLADDRDAGSYRLHKSVTKSAFRVWIPGGDFPVWRQCP